MTRFIAVFLFFLSATTTASAQTTTVWEIGKFDQSSSEFSDVTADKVLYRVGTSDWSKDWPGTQKAGSKYEIDFPLERAPRGSYVLTDSVSPYALSRIPALHVEVNGHGGVFYLDLKSSYGTLNARPPSQTLIIDIPVSYLHKGLNSLILSCIDTRPTETAPHEVPGIRYDALSLTNDPQSAKRSNAIDARVNPQIFYREKDGHLFEIVDATLQFAHPLPAGHVELNIAGKSYQTSFSATEDFGEERLEFEVPEWTGTTQGQLKVTAGRHFAFDMPLTAARKWTIFVVPHTHVDVGFTDNQGKVAEVQARELDQAIEMIHEHPTFKFTTDGSWNVEQFLNTRPKQQQDELLELAREDKIGIPADYVNLLTGYASLETLYRSLYYSKWLSRNYGVPFTFASITDVPTYSGAYPSILASAGIKYWAAGPNSDRAPNKILWSWKEDSPFWWEGPDGKKVLFWYDRGYVDLLSIFGGRPPQLVAAYDILPYFLQPFSSASYKPDAILAYGSQEENVEMFPQTATVASEWDREYAFPKMQYATFTDFFQYIVEHYGSDLKTYKGDMGPYWEDGVGSDAYYTAVDRQSQNRALSADILSTLSQSVNPGIHPPEAELDDAWRNIVLYSEHTWRNAGHSLAQNDSEAMVKGFGVKDNHAVQAKYELDDLTQREMSQLAEQIHVPAGTFLVFNGLSWKRDTLIEADMPDNNELTDMTTGQVVPVEMLFKKNNFMHVRFLASNLPPVGYKCFKILPAVAANAIELQTDKNPIIENQYYRITVDPKAGAIQSIFDKRLQRELVDERSPYKFGQYLYVTGGDGQTRIVYSREENPLAQLTIHPATEGEYLGSAKTPWGSSIRLRSSDVNTPRIDLEVLLFNDRKRIEFQYKVQKQYTPAKEGIYFAFPIAVSSPHFGYSIQQGWVDPAKDLLKGGSLEWFTVQHWMEASDSSLAVGIVPVDAPLASFGDINRGEWPAEFRPKSSTIFSYAMNNYWHTNTPPEQGGNFTFRYVLTSQDHLDPAALTKIGWESLEPAELDYVLPQDKLGDPERPLPAEGTSFLKIDAPNIVLVDWKLAEDGKGTILRLQEIAGQSTEATVQVPHSLINSASLCNAVEDNLQPFDVTAHGIRLTFSPNEVLTVRVEFDSGR
jgi:alpha-mannosidase